MSRCSKGGDWMSAVRRPKNKCQEPTTDGSMYCAEHRAEALERVQAMKKEGSLSQSTSVVTVAKPECDWSDSDCDGDEPWTSVCEGCGRRLAICDYHFGYHVACEDIGPPCPTCGFRSQSTSVSSGGQPTDCG